VVNRDLLNASRACLLLAGWDLRSKKPRALAEADMEHLAGIMQVAEDMTAGSLDKEEASNAYLSLYRARVAKGDLPSQLAVESISDIELALAEAAGAMRAVIQLLSR